VESQAAKGGKSCCKGAKSCCKGEGNQAARVVPGDWKRHTTANTHMQTSSTMTCKSVCTPWVDSSHVIHSAYDTSGQTDASVQECGLWRWQVINAWKRVVIMTTVQQNGMALKFMDEDMRSNVDVVRVAVQQNGMALKFACDSLRDDPDTVCIACESVPDSFRFASDVLKMCMELLLVLVRESCTILEHANATVRGDRNAMLQLIEVNGCSIQYAHDSLKNDIEFLIDAFRIGDPLCLALAITEKNVILIGIILATIDERHLLQGPGAAIIRTNKMLRKCAMLDLEVRSISGMCVTVVNIRSMTVLDLKQVLSTVTGLPCECVRLRLMLPTRSPIDLSDDDVPVYQSDVHHSFFQWTMLFKNTPPTDWPHALAIFSCDGRDQELKAANVPDA
jgi:hypothetical protein